MASMNDIRRSISSIESTGQITKAMKMVASSKLRRAQSAVVAARPYAEKVREVLGSLSNESGASSNPLMEVREVKKVLYIIVSADSGLCGGFNANVTKECERAIKANEHECDVVAVGKRGRDFFRKRGYNLVSEYIEIGDTPTFATGKTIAQDVIKRYIEGEYDEVHLVYSVFKSALSNTPTDVKVLPIEALPAEEKAGEEKEEQGFSLTYSFEPSEEEVLDVLLPAYVETLIYAAILESKASEHGSRMTAMSAATDNAMELIQSLTLTLNRARQAAITTEINEIVGGAAALE
ncbi:MAG: ATP synthase F1 subunit gamma [Bacillota bacterium]|jgi:F-type H+-transporting ATPase subunit gamma